MTVKGKGKSLRRELSAHLRARDPCDPTRFAAMSSSENVRYLKNSFTTIKHLLKPFRKLKKGYSRNLHGFFDDIETFLQRLYDVINFLDSENKEPTRQDVIDFLKRRRRDVTSDQLHGRTTCQCTACRSTIGQHDESGAPPTRNSNAKRRRT